MHSTTGVVNCVEYLAGSNFLHKLNCDVDENEFSSFLPVSCDILKSLDLSNLDYKKKKVKIGKDFL